MSRVRMDTVTIRNGRLIVELSNLGGSTANRMTADAIRIQRINGNLGNDDDFRLGAGSAGIDAAVLSGVFSRRLKQKGFTIVGEDGTFTIGDVPPGKYKIEAFHPKLGFVEKEVEVAGGGKATADFEFAGK